MRPIRRVLVVHPYGIGDLLFITPVLRALRLVPSAEKVDLLLGSRTEAVVSSNPHVDEIYSIDKARVHQQSSLENLRELWTLGQKLRENRYDLLLDYSLRGEYAFFSQFLLGIPNRAGFDYKRRGFFHNIRIPLQGGFKSKSIVDYVCDLAEEAGIEVEDRFLEFYPSASERKAASQTLQFIGGPMNSQFLAVSPGGGESWGKDAHFKRWPVRFFAELIGKLTCDMDFGSVVILGSPSEKEIGNELFRCLNLPAKNLAGETSFGESAAILEKAGLFLGNDGGLVHLAHALRVPTLAFYGPVDPIVYGPFPPSESALPVFKKDLECRPCYQNFRYESDCPHRDCLQSLTPAEVLRMPEVQKFLASRKQLSVK